MIELTPEQWQAIGQQDTPTVIQPESKTAYVIVPKAQYDKLRTLAADEGDVARVVRIAWMRRMLLDEDEITDSLKSDPPISIQEEMKQWKALDHLDKFTPSAEVLQRFAIKYR